MLHDFSSQTYRLGLTATSSKAGLFLPPTPRIQPDNQPIRSNSYVIGHLPFQSRKGAYIAIDPVADHVSVPRGHAGGYGQR